MTRLNRSLTADHPSPLSESSTSLSYSASRCLRIEVVAVFGLEAVLAVGQMPFLYGIGLLQKAKRSGKDIGTEGEALCSHFRALSYAEINHWDPLLFRQAKGSREDQEEFYSKIWRLHMHFDCFIFIDNLGRLGHLRLIEPKFAELEVDITLDITLDVGAGELHYKLIRDHVEGNDYRISVSDSHPRNPSPRDTSQDFQDGHFALGVD